MQHGDIIITDVDGVVVVPVAVEVAVLAAAKAKDAGENNVRSELSKGRSPREVFDEFGIL